MSGIFKDKAKNCKNETKCLSQEDKENLKKQLSQFKI